MKTTIKTIALTVIAIMTLSILSCEKEGLTGKRLAKHYIQKYISPTIYLNMLEYQIAGDEPDGWRFYPPDIVFDSDKVAIFTHHTPKRYMIGKDGSSLYTYKETEEFENEHVIEGTLKSSDLAIYDKPYNPQINNIYDSLARAHNDTNYNRSIFITCNFIMLYRKIESINIVSDTDYDVSHSAGTNLNDIFKVRFYSALEYIESNKRDVYGGTIGLTEPLVQFNSEKRKLTADMKIFTLTVAPTKTSTHRFTLTYTDEDGKVLTTTTDPITINGEN